MINIPPSMRVRSTPKKAGRYSHCVIHQGTKPASPNGAMTKNRAEPKTAIAFDMSVLPVVSTDTCRNKCPDKLCHDTYSQNNQCNGRVDEGRSRSQERHHYRRDAPIEHISDDVRLD